MSTVKQPAEFNRLSGGLVTGANPLTQPLHTTQEELNFLLHSDGSRTRRLGMDFVSSSTMTSSLTYFTDTGIAYRSFLWSGAGGVDGTQLVVIQTGTTLFISNSPTQLISENHTKIENVSSDASKLMSFASIDGLLVVATGEGKPKLYEYNGSSVTFYGDVTLRVRDMFGEKDYYSAYSYASPSSFDDLLSENFVNQRVPTLTRNHEYNLRNQGWGLRMASWEPLLEHDHGSKGSDPIWQFNRLTGDGYPSNADYPTPFFKLNGGAGVHSRILRFDALDCAVNAPSNVRAPAGSFVIDLFNRGQSREEELQRVVNKYGWPTAAGTLHSDRFEGGPSVVAEFAGRIWYAGFTGENIDGHQHSPYLPSYLAYSQIVEKTSQIGKCFQDGDPTSRETPDLLDTDGGLLRIEDVGEIKALTKLGDTLAVLSDKGVWMISGGESIFTANTQLVRKVSAKGVVGPNSVVVVGSTLFYWGESGIYAVYRNGVNWSTIEVSINIRTHLNSLSEAEKEKVIGVYDEINDSISWLTGNQPDELYQKEVVFNTKLGAFSLTEGGPIDKYPVLSLPFSTPSTTSVANTGSVTDSGVAVTDGGATVTDTAYVSVAVTPSIHYLTLVDGTLSWKEASYNAVDYVDWKSYDLTGRDAYAYMLLPWFNGADTQRRKQINYGTFHLQPEMVGSNTTSCMVTSYWDWKYSTTTGEKDVFRFTRASEAADPASYVGLYDSLACRHKIRGRGRSVSLLLDTTAGSPLRLHGWGLDLDVNKKV